MVIPEGLYYAKSHEWVKFLSEDSCLVGISDYAQAALGDIVFINLPQAGDSVTAGEPLCDLESVKAVADVYAPVSGVIEEVNQELDEACELINSAPYEAWIARISGVTSRDGLMDAAAYKAHCEAEAQP